MPRSPLRIGVTELRRRPGTQREVDVTAPVPDLAITTARVPEGTEVHIEGVLEAIEGAITFQGTLDVPWTGECRRCLDDVLGSASVEVREVFETRPVPGETYALEGDELDLEPLVRDTVLLNLPLAPLCRESCQGPAPDAFPAQVGDAGPPEDGGEPPRDPRWAALDQLRLDPED
ncbi:MAG: DUF177 domain-containing protein [Actinomycetota bacterium]|nr:DUF177 domain-containing protein [Actinomycetota bacterium]